MNWKLDFSPVTRAKFHKLDTSPFEVLEEYRDSQLTHGGRALGLSTFDCDGVVVI